MINDNNDNDNVIHLWIEVSGYLNGSVMEEQVDMAILTRNIQLVAEALARYMFALSDSGLVCLSIESLSYCFKAFSL